MEGALISKSGGSKVRLLGLCFGTGIFMAVPAAIAAGPEPAQIEKQFQAPAVPKSGGAMDLAIPEGRRVSDERFEKIKLTLKQVALEGGTVYPKADLEKEFAKLVGKEVTLADVYRIAERITEKYRADGYILSRAMIPAQKIDAASGVVRVVVVEGFIRKVIVESADASGEAGKAKLSRIEKRIHSYVDKIMASKPLNVRELERYLLLANDVDGVTAKAVLQPATDTPGAADLILKTSFKMAGGALIYDNMGTQIMGPTQGTVEGKISSPFGFGEQLKLMAVGAPPLSAETNLKFLNGTLKVPIGNEGLVLKAEAIHTRVEPGDSMQALGFVGINDTYGLAASYPVIRGRSQNLTLEAGARKTASTVEILEKPFNEDRIRKGYLKGSLDFSDSLAGVNLITAQVTQGFDIESATKYGDPLSSRAEAAPRFTKYEGELSRLQSLPYNFSLLVAFMWQQTDEPMFSSEEFAVGGSKYGRGYDLSEIAGDKGFADKLEVQYNAELFGTVTYQPYVFWDHGRVWNLDDVATGTPSEEQWLRSFGVGVRGSFKKMINFETYLADPLNRKPMYEASNAFRWFGQVSVNF